MRAGGSTQVRVPDEFVISRTFADRLRIDERTRRHDTEGARLGDGSKNAVERCLKSQ
jgi:hypothetical protein